MAKKKIRRKTKKKRISLQIGKSLQIGRAPAPKNKLRLLRIDNAREVCRQVIAKLRPSPSEKKAMNSKIRDFLQRINKPLAVHGAKAILGGSGAKGTWLAGEFDADIFVLFDYKKYSGNDEQISEILKSVLENKFGKDSVETLQGSRHYFQISKNENFQTSKKENGEFIYELVPILNIKNAEQAKNITDISPLHTKWVLGKVKKNTKHKSVLADEIRLTKSFCKAQGIYGAESYINGLSGYACEVLTAHYGSFIELVRTAAEGWQVNDNSKRTREKSVREQFKIMSKIIIDPENQWRGKSVELELNTSKITGPLILVDPVQAGRNVTAALSKEKFEIFRDRCHEFLREPGEEFFFRKKMEMHEIKELVRTYPDSKVIIVEAVSMPGREDSVGCRLLKLHDKIAAELKLAGFQTYLKDWDFDRKQTAIMWFVTNKAELKKMQAHQGPPISLTKFIEEFKKKHKITFEQEGRIWAEVERKFILAEDLIEDVLKTALVENTLPGQKQQLKYARIIWPRKK